MSNNVTLSSIDKKEVVSRSFLYSDAYVFQMCNDLFDLVDSDSDGALSMLDFVKLFKSRKFSTGSELKINVLDYFRQIDSDRSGKISVGELAEHIKSNNDTKMLSLIDSMVKKKEQPHEEGVKKEDTLLQDIYLPEKKILPNSHFSPTRPSVVHLGKTKIVSTFRKNKEVLKATSESVKVAAIDIRVGDFKKEKSGDRINILKPALELNDAVKSLNSLLDEHDNDYGPIEKYTDEGNRIRATNERTELSSPTDLTSYLPPPPPPPPSSNIVKKDCVSDERMLEGVDEIETYNDPNAGIAFNTMKHELEESRKVIVRHVHCAANLRKEIQKTKAEHEKDMVALKESFHNEASVTAEKNRKLGTAFGVEISDLKKAVSEARERETLLSQKLETTKRQFQKRHDRSTEAIAFVLTKIENYLSEIDS